MPPPAPPIYKLAEIRMSGICASQGSSAFKVDNIFHFQRTATVSLWDPVAIENAFQAAIAVPITNALNARYTQTNTTVRCVDDYYDQGAIVSRAVAGQVAGDSMPSMCYAYLLAETGFRGKMWRGNKKFFPLSESNTTAGTADLLNAAGIVLFGLVATALLSGFTDANGNIFKYGVLSRISSILSPKDGAPPTVPNWTQVKSINVRKSIGRMSKHEAASAY